MAPGPSVVRSCDGRRGWGRNFAQIEFMGEITAGRVLFGPDDVEPLLGVTQLESAAIVIDPRTGQLKRLPAIPLKHFAATAS